MTWLLKLYPPRWRRRYGAEFHDLIASQRFSFFTALDIIGGAIDAWTRPQSHLATPDQSKGDATMLAKIIRARNAGAKTTMADGVKGAAVILGATLLSVFAATWMRRHSVDPEYTKAVVTNGWLFGFILSMPFTSLKGWPARAQVIFVGAILMIVTSIVLINIH